MGKNFRRHPPLIMAAVVGAVSLVVGVLPATASAQPALPQGADMTVVAVHSGQVLDVDGNSQEPGAPVIQWLAHGGANQRWTFEALDDDTHRIVVAHSGQVLDVDGNSQEPGAQVIQWPWHGGDNQRWRIEDVPGQGSRIVAVHSGQVLDVDRNSQEPGAPVIQWPWHGGANQRWELDGRLDADDVLAPDIDAGPEVGESSGPVVSVTEVRLGRHNGFDRVVFAIGGEGQAGWDVRYVDEARAAGSGLPIDVDGEAILRLNLENIALPPDAPAGVEPWDGPERLHLEGAGPVAEVVEDKVFEGVHTFFVGVTGATPFQVNRLASPQRVVIDVAAP
ncbi:MAG TPA: RICIN domain-containing protein [Acidimicrobiales bacterium]|nr:RICIN domain-containing protein [Acidimicrobiales bacterium]